MMNILYLGKYKARFTHVIKHIKNLPSNSNVLELCFGDVYLASFCRAAGYKWKGIDLNKNFVLHARKLGYDASFEDLTTFEDLPKADVCIMIGSLYHFHPDTCLILSKMFQSSDFVIISEPVRNLSSTKGLIGFLARRSANAGRGNEEFRFNFSSILDTLNECGKLLNFRIVSTEQYGKDLIVKLLRNGNN